MNRKLTLADIADVREYERNRVAFRSTVMELKRVRRVAIGTVVSVAFENRTTMLYQIQEMARVEKLFTDEAIQAEIDTYNSLIPDVGQLCATVFIELTSDEALREWLPRLVGIERALVLHLDGGETVRCHVDSQHDSQLTREYVTAAVHYVSVALTPAQVDAFARGATLHVDHPSYRESVELGAETRRELLSDLR